MSIPLTMPVERSTAVEERTRAIGRQIFSLVRESGGEGWLEARLMDLTLRDERVKAELFRFVDVLPVLSDDRQVVLHLREYLLSVQHRLPIWLVNVVRQMPDEGWPVEIVATLARFGASRMAKRFIPASNVPQALHMVKQLRKRSMAFTVDLLGEAVLSEAEADRYAAEYHTLIEGLADAARAWSSVPMLDNSPAGPIPRINVSVKLSSLFSQFDPASPEGTTTAVLGRLRPILQSARRRGVFVNFDMEQFAYKDLTLAIFRSVLSEAEFADWTDVGLAIQAYLESSGDDLRALVQWAQRRGAPVWVRLVKGAYWDYETVVARQNGWPLPVYARKAQTDANYEALTAFLIANHAHLRPAIASHNIRSIAHALALAESYLLPPRLLEFQMLYGMADPIKTSLVAMGQRVRVYTPYGQLLPGMAYLVRRLLENTSNESFLRAGMHGHATEEHLLMNPLQNLEIQSTSRHDPRNAVLVQRPSFVNEAMVDFTRADQRQAMLNALSAIENQVGQSQAIIIAGCKVETGRWIESINPSFRRQVLGRAAAAGINEVKQAIAAGVDVFESWRQTPVRERARLLQNAANILRRRRFELGPVCRICDRVYTRFFK